MPELLEVEAYRRAADHVVGRPIRSVHAPDPWFLKGGLSARSARSALVGRTPVGTRRRGKLLLVDLDSGPVLGLRFGMTGRLVVDGGAPIERLQYASHRSEPAWERFGLGLGDGGHLAVIDPRRLGGVILDPDEDALGPDATSVGPADLRRILAGSAAPLKARLMDQSRLAGLGNLLADETLWRAGFDPARAAGSLDAGEVRRLHRHLRATLTELDERGGSHTGDLMEARHPRGRCPRDGAELLRRTVGGRTTYSCPRHQR